MVEAGPIAIATVNELEADTFVALFGAVFEDTPALAAAAFERRPFADRDDLLAAFELVLAALPAADHLALLRAHPMLGATGPMAAASVDEQASAGLDDVDAELRARLAADNQAYLARFGFPFVIAVRGLGVADIAAAMTVRLHQPAEVEQATALEQVARIAALRIERLVEP